MTVASILLIALAYKILRAIYKIREIRSLTGVNCNENLTNLRFSYLLAQIC